MHIYMSHELKLTIVNINQNILILNEIKSLQLLVEGNAKCINKYWGKMMNF